MTSTSNESLTSDAEGGELLLTDFTQYRQLCDQATNGFRKIGLQDEAAYYEASRDPRTVFCTLGSARYPLMVPLEYEIMYNAARTRQLTGKTEAMLCTLPISSLSAEVDDLDITDLPNMSDAAILFEQIHTTDPDQRRAQRTAVAQLLDPSLKPHDFINPDLLDKEGHETAWMGIYGFSVDPVGAVPITSAHETGQALIQGWEAYTLENRVSDNVLLRSDQLQQNPELMAKLWQIAQVGFGEILGAYHPVSMEIGEQVFRDRVLAEGTLTAIRFYEGQPACFGTIMPNMDHNDWLDCQSTVLKQDIAAAQAEGRGLVHFFELIGNGMQGVGFGKDILQLYLNVANYSQRPYRIYFESTNLSSLYIPHITTQCAARVPSLELTRPVTQLQQLDYWYLAAV